MVYRLRQDDGAHWLSGSWIDPQGISRPLSAEEIELKVKSRRKIDSGDGKRIELPLEWLISLPSRGLSWQVKPLYDQQWMATEIPYWEGVVIVNDEMRRPVGRGYMELTGYE